MGDCKRIPFAQMRADCLQKVIARCRFGRGVTTQLRCVVCLSRNIKSRQPWTISTRIEDEPHRRKSVETSNVFEKSGIADMTAS